MGKAGSLYTASAAMAVAAASSIIVRALSLENHTPAETTTDDHTINKQTNSTF